MLVAVYQQVFLINMLVVANTYQGTSERHCTPHAAGSTHTLSWRERLRWLSFSSKRWDVPANVMNSLLNVFERADGETSTKREVIDFGALE